LEIGSCFLPRQAWIIILLFYAFCHCWDDRCAPPHSAFSIKIGSQKLFLHRLTSNWDCLLSWKVVSYDINSRMTIFSQYFEDTVSVSSGIHSWKLACQFSFSIVVSMAFLCARL
jgi:hypothetical protein